VRVQPLGYLIRVLPEEIKFGRLKINLYLCLMKTNLPYCSSHVGVIGYQDSEIAKRETNDCVVRAFATSFEVPYDKAHKYVKEKFGRVDRKGTYGTVFKMVELAKKQTQINHKKIKPIGTKTTMRNYVVYSLEYKVKINGKKINRKMTVGTFIKENPIGTFFILVNRHAFTIKDGIVHGNYEDSVKRKRIVKHAFQIK